MHAHVVAICRHCGRSNQFEVCETLPEAQKFLEEFPRRALTPPPGFNDPEACEKLRNAKIVKIDDNLMRMSLGVHDLIHFTLECEAELQSCQREHMMELFKREVMQQLGGMMMGMMEEMPKHKHSEEPQTMRDTSNNILNQLDLPDDFFGPQAH